MTEPISILGLMDTLPGWFKGASFLAINVANLGRALPSLAILAFALPV